MERVGFWLETAQPTICTSFKVLTTVLPVCHPEDGLGLSPARLSGFPRPRLDPAYSQALDQCGLPGIQLPLVCDPRPIAFRFESEAHLELWVRGRGSSTWARSESRKHNQRPRHRLVDDPRHPPRVMATDPSWMGLFLFSCRRLPGLCMRPGRLERRLARGLR